MLSRLSPCLLVLAVASCGREEKQTSITASARLDGANVVVEAQCNLPAEVVIGEQTVPCIPSTPGVVRVPVEQLGAGAHTIKVTGKGPGKPVTTAVTIEVPATAIAPFLTIVECASDTGGEYLDLEVDGGAKQDCKSYGGARIKLIGKSSPKAKLTIGGKTVEVAASGDFQMIADLSEGILALTIDDLVSHEIDASARITVPWKLDAGGKQLEGKLTVSVKFGSHRKLVGQWLRDVVDGKIDPPVFTPRAEGRQTVVRVPDDNVSELESTDRRGTVRELGFIAVDRETQRTQDGTCEFQSGGKVTVATRYSVETEVRVFSTATGKVIATKRFLPGKGCPSFAMLSPDKPETAVVVRDEEVTQWLDTLAVAPAPTAPAASR